MDYFYSVVILLCILSMISLAIDVGKNTILSSSDIKWFRFTFILVIIGALCEYSGAVFDTLGGYPPLLHKIITTVEFSISPYLVVALSRSCGMKKSIVSMSIGMVIHALFEIVAVCYGWVFFIDSSGRSQRGPLFIVYIIVVGIAFLYILSIFILLGKRSKLRNSISLILISLLIIAGQVANIIDENIRTGYISICFTAILLYIFIQNMLRHIMLETIDIEQEISNHDSLTKVLSRNSYENKVREIDRIINKDKDVLQFAVCECDLNNLKIINDTFGHDSGDIYIQNCCKTICNYFKHSPVYRIGGDEFVIILQNEDFEHIKAIKTIVTENAISEIRKNCSLIEKNSFATGFAVFDKSTDLSFSSVLKRADIEMYNQKRMLKSL